MLISLKLMPSGALTAHALTCARSGFPRGETLFANADFWEIGPKKAPINDASRRSKLTCDQLA